MNILLALDDSTRAIDEALSLAATRGAKLTALFVLDTGWSVYTGHDFLLGSHARSDFLEYAKADELAQHRETLEALAARAQAKGVEVEFKTAGNVRVAEAITEEMETGGYDMLVMSHPFRRGLEVMRDAAANVLKKAKCDVLFVRRDE